MLLAGPFVITALTMMQQHEMQVQMDGIIDCSGGSVAGDGVPDRPRAAAAADEAGAALRDAAAGVAGAVSTLFARKTGQAAPDRTADET